MSRGSRAAAAVLAFTLLELIVVIAVIALLAALAVPAFQRVLASGRTTACVSNLRQLSVTLNSYLADHDNRMPVLRSGRAKRTDDVPVIDNTLAPYTTDQAIFACPADPRFAAESGTSYFWNVTLNGQALGSLNFLGLVEAHSRIPILGDKEGFHQYLKDKINILYADGHATKEVKFFTSE